MFSHRFASVVYLNRNCPPKTITKELHYALSPWPWVWVWSSWATQMLTISSHLSMGGENPLHTEPDPQKRQRMARTRGKCVYYIEHLLGCVAVEPHRFVSTHSNRIHSNEHDLWSQILCPTNTRGQSPAICIFFLIRSKWLVVAAYYTDNGCIPNRYGYFSGLF